MKERYYFDPLVRKNDEYLHIDIYESFGNTTQRIGRVTDKSYSILMREVYAIVKFLNNGGGHKKTSIERMMMTLQFYTGVFTHSIISTIKNLKK